MGALFWLQNTRTRTFSYGHGVHYIISGGGGSSLYKCKPDDKMVICDRRYNYVRFHVDGSKIRWVAYDKAGAVIEEYTIGQ